MKLTVKIWGHVSVSVLLLVKHGQLMLVPKTCKIRVLLNQWCQGFQQIRSHETYYKIRERPPWRVLFFGTDDFSLRSLEYLYEETKLKVSASPLLSKLEVVSIQPKNSVPPVRKFASAHGIPIHDWPLRIPPEDFDIGVVASFGHLIPQKIINTFPLGMLNVHASLLPRWRGAAPVVHAILHGDTETGITIMKIKPHRFDIGEIVLQETCHITNEITSKQLTTELALVGAKNLMKCFQDLTSYLQNATLQPETGVTKAPKIKSSMAVIHWDKKSSTEVCNQYRALSDYMRFETTWKGSVVRLTNKISPEEMETFNMDAIVKDAKPGRFFFHKKRKVLCVKCMVGWIAFQNISITGKKTMTSVDFYNGYISKVKEEDCHFECDVIK